MGRFQDAKIERKCITCHKKYVAVSPAQLMCGSTTQKKGCSFEKHLERKRISQRKLAKKNNSSVA